jgi:cytochrome c peroxidase
MVIGSWSPGLLRAATTPNTGMADPDALIRAFDKFQIALKANGGERYLTIPLTMLRGITTGATNPGGAGGSVTIDLSTSSLTSTVTGLPIGKSFDLWLVNNRPAANDTTLAETQDLMLRAGTFLEQSGEYHLSATLAAGWIHDLLPDRAYVVPSNQTPLSSFILTGAAAIFDRLLHRQVHFDPTNPSTRRLNFAQLIAQGRRLFVNETFNGNGRACGTCHRENHNFTIDAPFIATLPPTDPLFVAENNPALAADFEKPNLMRTLGLIIENVDGFEDLHDKFVMRSVQTVFALGNSSLRPDPAFGVDFTSNGRNADPPERLGWSQDGAPLRDFALVAITQHATKTLNRVRGVDFRVPTDEELDALAAYQLALGRQEDFDLRHLKLKSALASTGQALFLDTGVRGQAGHKNCNACHFNAGATTGISFSSAIPNFSPLLDGNPRGFNMSAPINVNGTPLAMMLQLPRDGGFGTLPTPLGGFGNFAKLPVGLVPIEEFNIPPLVEAADTAPFFHNHTIPDLESAVAFYGDTAFQAADPVSIGGPNGLVPITISKDPNDPEVQAIAAFLRVLNTLENIRSSISLALRARSMTQDNDARDLAKLAVAEATDAINVLNAGSLVNSAEASILSARTSLITTRLSLEFAAEQIARQQLNMALEQSVASLRVARSALAFVDTLPPSYR